MLQQKLNKKNTRRCLNKSEETTNIKRINFIKTGSGGLVDELTGPPASGAKTNLRIEEIHGTKKIHLSKLTPSTMKMSNPCESKTDVHTKRVESVPKDNFSKKRSVNTDDLPALQTETRKFPSRTRLSIQQITEAK